MSEQGTSTSLGQQDLSSPDYGPSYFLNYWGGGGPYERNERWLKFFEGVADGIVRDLHPISALDAGCAMGFLVEALRKRGVDASGVDISEYAISRVDASVAEHCRVGSLTEPLGGRYDLIACIEVLEHIPPAEADAAIANLCAATDRLLLSSTPGDYGEPTHLNVQPPEVWSAKFAQHGFMRDLDLDLSYISPWAVLYTRRQTPLADTVREYDRAWWRLRREVTEVRASLLESQDKLAELEGGDGLGNRSEMAAELDRRQEEILRLRDLLIGKEAELGAAKGHLADLEDRWKRLAGAKYKLESQIPLFGVLFAAARRVLRRRR